MTDETSRLARLEERMKNIESWISEHENVDVDVSLLKKCVETYNGDIKAIKGTVSELHDTITEWIGGLKLIRWVIGGFGIVVIAQFILSAVKF